MMMSEKEEVERVIVFIDGSNHYHIIKELCPSKKPYLFDFEKFIKYLIGKRKHVRTYYYGVPLDISYNEKKYMKQQQFFDRLQRIPDFHLILCRMQKIKIDGKSTYRAKEDDIHLAVDMVKLAYNDAYDTAILVSSDGDFVPAIIVVKEKGKKVENIGFENKFSYHLRQKSDRFRKLSKNEVEQFYQEELSEKKNDEKES